MTEIAAFFAGFTAGWAVRATTDSSRALVVAAIAKVYETADRTRTLMAMEREAIEDLLAEAKAQYETSKRRPASGAQASSAASSRATPAANGARGEA